MRIREIIILFVISIFSIQAPAQQSSRTKELENKRKSLLEDIKQTSDLIEKNKKSITGILKHINLVTEQIKNRKQLVNLLNTEINVLNEEIKSKELQISNLERDLLSKKEKYLLAVQKMHRNKNSYNELLFLLSADDFAQSYRRLLYLKKYSDWQKTQAEAIRSQQRQIIAEKATLEGTKIEKEALSLLKKNEENQLLQEETKKKGEVADLQKNSKKLQNELAKKKKQADALNKEIERIIKAEIEAARKKAQSQPKVERKAETKGGYAMTKEEQKLSSNFALNRGKLPFPLRGKYSIAGRFGQQSVEGLKNVVYNSNGIEIKTTDGNNARAVFDGTVTAIFKIDGFQLSVIVRHGNYLTLYSYLETVNVKQGDNVITGQEIGKIYTDSEQGTILHFELWKENTKLNPEPWLDK
ncbi:MAG: peptidoglycan DD-metalloendopeptidase family protein [Dysgonamonadaceae bacterium]|jgi:septal ring factor EnvC (AmiA/AmiB activator)|nr:peptidoglycan DD-metalloendopeptidase family protein [Dysgonamonadaceae bacterium]